MGRWGDEGLFVKGFSGEMGDGGLFVKGLSGKMGDGGLLGEGFSGKMGKGRIIGRGIQWGDGEKIWVKCGSERHRLYRNKIVKRISILKTTIAFYK